MICEFCGKQIPDEAIFCCFCGIPVNGGDGPDRDGGTDPFDDYAVYDNFEGDEGETFDLNFYEQNEFIQNALSQAKEERRTGRTKKRSRRGKSAAVITSVFLCILIVLSALSGIFRYVTGDGTVRKTVADKGLDGLPVSVSPEDGGEAQSGNFSDYLCDTVAEAGRKYGITARDVRRLMNEDSFKAYFGDLFAGRKNDLFEGRELAPYRFGELTDWMYENADTVKNATGLSVDEEVRDDLKGELDLCTLNFGSSSFEEITGVGRDAATFFLSDIFFYLSLVLCVGAAAMAFAFTDFDRRFFLSCAGFVLLAAGIILLCVFGFILISGKDSGIIMSILVSASLKPFMIVCGSAVFLGIILVFISFIADRRRRRIAAEKD